MTKRRVIAVLVLLMIVGVPQLFAAGGGGGMPWETTLTRIQTSLTGPVATAVGVILIVGAGLFLAFSEGQGLKRVMWVLVGVGIALNASNLLMNFFGTSGGALVGQYARQVLEIV